MIGHFKKRLPAREIIFQAITLFGFFLFTFICIFPFYYIFAVSISDNLLVGKGQVLFYPRGIHFTNYLDAFKLQGFGRSAFVSLARTILGTLLTVFSSMWMGYSFSRPEFWGKKFWYKFCLITMYFSAGLIPVYLNYKILGMINTFWIYIINFVSVFNVILAKTFIESLPDSLEESMEIDGAGFLTRFFQLVLPLSMPIVATLTVFCAVGHWNSYMDTVLYVTDSKIFTLQYVLYQYINSAQVLANIMKNSGSGVSQDLLKHQATATSLRMTVTMIVTLPILFVYPFFQRYFIKGLMLGAIKG